MRNPDKLQVLESARTLAVVVYRATGRFPSSERFGLQSQIRRAAVSMAANIAEGHGRGTQGDFERHLRIASGSLAESDTLLAIAHDLQLLSSEGPESIRLRYADLGRSLVSLTQRVASQRS